MYQLKHYHMVYFFASQAQLRHAVDESAIPHSSLRWCNGAYDTQSRRVVKSRHMHEDKATELYHLLEENGMDVSVIFS